MFLYTVKHFTRLARNTVSYVHLKTYKTNMSELKSEKKIYICSECNKPKEDIRSSRNNSKCCCSCELMSVHSNSNDIII